MVRLPQDRSDRILPRSHERKLPYNKHPIYQLRKWLIVIALIGLVLSMPSWGPFGAVTGFSILFLALSVFLALADLTAYAMEKVQHPDQEPEWPRTIIMVFDVILSVLLQFTFWSYMAAVSYQYTYGVWVLGAYAALMGFVSSLIHFYSFWKQLMARYKEKWLASLADEPCARCGYIEVPGETTTTRHIPHPPHNTFTYAGPSADTRGSTTLTPESTESNMEEGLLIGSDFEYRDDPVDEQEPTIDLAEQVVAAKGKGKRKKTVAKPLPTVPDQIEES